MANLTYYAPELTLSSKMVSAYHGSHANILVRNFIHENSHLTISSLIDYCLHNYTNYGVTKQIIAKQMHDYIMERN